MTWLDSHAAAIQALAGIATLLVTITLACLTAWYVKVTRSIARSAGEQAEYLKDQLIHAKKESNAARSQAASALLALVRRLQASLVGLDAQSPRHRQLLEHSQLGLVDIEQLERLATDVSAVAAFHTGQTVEALRTIHSVISDARTVNIVTGWVASDAQNTAWLAAMAAAPKALERLEGDTQDHLSGYLRWKAKQKD